MQRQVRSSFTLTTTLVVFAAMILATAASAATEKVLHAFPYGKRGALPIAPLVFDSAGNLYGTTDTGGSHNLGTVFELTPNSSGGWTEKALHTFSGADGANPRAGLILDSTGNLYGTTESGGVGYGTVFELTPAGNGAWAEKVLFAFAGGTDGVNPLAGLIFDKVGSLYGTTTSGGGTGCGGSGCGTVFELTPTGNGSWVEKVLYAFAGGTDGANPEAGLIFDTVGNLYGTTSGGSGLGTVFTVSPNGSGGWSETVLHGFTGGSDGGYPSGGLIFDTSGNLYGTTGLGTVFELMPTGAVWKETVLYIFQGNSSANYLLGGLLLDTTGNLYGTTYGTTTDAAGTGCGGSDCGTVFELTPADNGTWLEKVVHTFVGADGANPYAGLIFDQNGNLYGTTGFGGPGGNGAVFELSPKSGVWTDTVLCSFADADGQYPRSGLILDASGNLYGTTSFGGSHNAGSVFELTPSTNGWTETLLYSFCAKLLCKDGMEPVAGLNLDASGNLYGTTSSGGSHNAGTVFKLTHVTGRWSESVLYSFCAKTACGDGANPEAGVIMDASGNLYGTTGKPGTIQRGEIFRQQGKVFELTPNSSGGWTEKALHTFSGADGANPRAGLILDSTGNLYGTTESGGVGYGTVFELTPAGNGAWAEKVLFAFAGGTDGVNPLAGLIFDKVGNLYGTTTSGGGTGCGGPGCGTVFELMPNAGGSWTESVLHRFRGGSDGEGPNGGVILDGFGNLYSTTLYGGSGLCNLSPSTGCGTLFELSPDGSGGWNESILYSFTGGSNGQGPLAGLILDPSGNLYGTTSTGTTSNVGVVFEFTP